MILFVFLFVGLVIVALYTLSFAAHTFLHILSSTAAGIDEVPWADEPMVDWIPRTVIMAWLVGVWLVPVGIIVKAAGLGANPAMPFLVAGGVLWLCLPIAVLSSMSATSKWVVFRPSVVLALIRVGPTTLGFYLMTAVLIGGNLTLWYLGIVRYFGLIAVAAVVGSVSLMIYARLVGRIAWRMRMLDGDPRRARKKDRSPARMVFGKKEDHARPAEESEEEVVTDEEVEAEEEPEPEPEPEEVPGRPRMPMGYDVTPEDRPPPVKAAPPPKIRAKARVERKLDRIQRQPKGLFEGVITFPFYETSQRMLMWLVLSSAVMGVIFAFVLQLWPHG